MSYPGALPPPPGVTPNLNGGNPLEATYTASLVVMLLFPAVMVPLRLYTKAYIIKSLKATDFACLLGFLLFIALISIGFVFLNVGMGKHAWDLSPQTYSRLAELLNVQQAVYMPAILFTKVAVLLQLMDIFVPNRHAKQGRWYGLVTLLALNVVFFTILMFIEIFQCTPRKKIWNPMIEGHCIDINKTFVATGTINVIDDFVILCLPLWWTWKLQLQRKRKIGVSLIFATGLFACITSVMRLAMSIKSLNNPDISTSLVPVSLWAVAEVSAGLVVCCLPLLPRLFGHRNARTRLEPSVPTGQSGNSRLLSNNQSQITGTGTGTESDKEGSVYSESAAPLRPQTPANTIYKSVKVEQTSNNV